MASAGSEQNIRRIVLLGKSGSGKSSLANTLLGKNEFKVSNSAASVTQCCDSGTQTVNGRRIEVVDTPGFFDTNLGEDRKSELIKCFTDCAKGVDSFLLVFPLGRFTSQEQEIVNHMVGEYFGEEALKYTTVVFTHGDQLEEGQKIEKWVKENKALNDLVNKCGGRCHVIDNKYWNNSQDKYRNNKYQVKQLLKTIEQTVDANNGGRYTNEMLQIVQRLINEKKEELKLSSPDEPEESLYQKAKKIVCDFLVNHWKAIAIEAILGALLGGCKGGVAGAVKGAVMAAIEEGLKAAGVPTEKLENALQPYVKHLKSQ